MLNNIEGLNDKIKEFLEERVKTGSKRIDADPKEIRRETDELYRGIRTVVNAAAITTPDDAKINDFIDQHNSLINEFKDVIAHMHRGGTGNEELPTGEVPPYPFDSELPTPEDIAMWFDEEGEIS